MAGKAAPIGEIVVGVDDKVFQDGLSSLTRQRDATVELTQEQIDAMLLGLGDVSSQTESSESAMSLIEQRSAENEARVASIEADAADVDTLVETKRAEADVAVHEIQDTVGDVHVEIAAAVEKMNVAAKEAMAVSRHIGEVRGELDQLKLLSQQETMLSTAAMAEVHRRIAETRAELSSLGVTAEVRLNTIWRTISMVKSTLFQFLEVAGITIDATLKAIIETGFSTVQLVFSLKMAAKIEGPTGWVRVPFLIASWAMNLAATFKAIADRQRINTELQAATAAGGRRTTRTIRQSVKI